MKPTIGLHVMGQDPNGVYDWNALFQWTTFAKPQRMLVMHNVTRAAELKRYMPIGSEVYHRVAVPDRKDQAPHMHYTPAQFLDLMPQDKRFIHQIGNEPLAYHLNNPDPWAKDNLHNYIRWLIEVVILANGRGLRLALPAFGVGNPDPWTIQMGWFDELLFWLFDSPVEHELIQHEYFTEHPLSEPWHVGEIVKAWLDRCRLLGLEPRLAVTEAGRDVGGGEGDGWRSAPWTDRSAAYWTRIEAQANVYKALGVPMLIYCYGIGFNWRSFDIQDDTFILSQLLGYNLELSSEGGSPVDTPLPVGTPIKRGTLTKMPSTAVNVRSSPSTTTSTVKFQIGVGAAGQFAEPIEIAGWFWYKADDGREGWISKQDGAVAFTESAPPPPPPAESPLLTKEDLLNLAATHSIIADLYLKAAQRGSNT